MGQPPGSTIPSYTEGATKVSMVSRFFCPVPMVCNSTMYVEAGMNQSVRAQGKIFRLQDASGSGDHSRLRQTIQVSPMVLCARASAEGAENMDQLHKALQVLNIVEYTTTLDNHRLISFRCTENDSLVVTTRRQLDLLPSAELIHADATYKAVPKRFGVQLFTIHGSCGGQVSIHLLCFVYPPNTTPMESVSSPKCSWR